MILQTALSIVDRDGADGLSIRRLSNAVGRDPVNALPARRQQGRSARRRAEIVLAQLSVDTADPN